MDDWCILGLDMLSAMAGSFLAGFAPSYTSLYHMQRKKKRKQGFLLEKDNKVTHAKNLISYEEFITGQCGESLQCRDFIGSM